MLFIYLCCFASPMLQIRYMQVSDVALVTLPHPDNQSPSLHLKRPFNVPREKADSHTTGMGGLGGGWGGPICALTQVFPWRQLWYQDKLTSARAHQLPRGEKINKKHEMDKYHPAVFDRCCRLDDCNKLGPHLDLQFHTVSNFFIHLHRNNCGWSFCPVDNSLSRYSCSVCM